MNLLSRFLSALLCTSVFTFTAHAENEKIYTIGIVPQYEIRQVRKTWLPILSELEKKTGYKIMLRGSPTIPDFEKELNEGVFDFAYMNPYHMLLAEKSQGYIPLVRDIGRSLHGILTVRQDSDIQSVNDLNDKKIAFPAPNALGASLLMRALLTNTYHIKFNPVYVKTHSSVYLNVITRQVAAGGGVQKTLNQQENNIKESLRILLHTPDVAPHPFAAHPRVPTKVREAIRKTLIQLGETPIGESLLSKIPIKKIGLAKMSDYTPLSTYNLEKFYVR